MALTDDRPGLGPDRPDDELGQMTLFEHLAELRNRLIVTILAVVAGTVVAWLFYNHAIDFMRQPYCSFVKHHAAKSVSGCNLVTNGPLEGLTTRIRVSAYAGVALASPVIFYELWRFITPGLHKNEKRYLIPFMISAVVLFAGGVATAIFIFPKALNFLIKVGGHGVVPLFSPARYFTLYVLMCLVFGLVFMYPLVIVFLELAGVVPSARWRKWRRPAIVIIALVAAVVTPSSDPFSFLAMAVPMLVFYEASILLGRVLHK